MTTVICIGTSHQTAPVEVRERVMAVAQDIRDSFAEEVSNGTRSSPITELVTLFTCNRAELYLAAPAAQREETLRWANAALAPARDGTSPEPSATLYCCEDLAAVRHLCRVSAGLESLVIGESQIAGQVARAFANIVRRDHVESTLTAVFDTSKRSGRRARAETGIGRKAASVSSLAVGLLREEYGDLRGKKVLLVGAGKMGRLAGEALAALGGAVITIANRTLSSAQNLAERIGGAAADITNLPALLADADVALLSAEAPHPLVDTAVVTTALEQRARSEPLMIVDIAVPRNVDPAVGAIPDVRLIGIDDLQSRIDAHLAERKDQVPLVAAIIEEEIAAYQVWCDTRDVHPLITDLRKHAETIRKGEIERALGDLSELDDGVRKRIEHLSRALVNKLLHEPTRRLRSDAQKYGREPYAGMTRELFGLGEPECQKTQPDR